MVLLHALLFHQPHGRHDQHPAVPGLKVIGTLPHPAVARPLHGLVHKGPLVQILTAVEQKLSLALPGTASHHQIPGIPAPPDLRVPGVCPVSHRGVCQRRDNHFLALPVVKSKAVFRGNHHLAGLKLFIQTPVDVLRVRHLIADPGIHQHQLSLRLHGTSGEAAVLVPPDSGKQGNPLMLPLHQVTADRMAPVHGSPPGTIRKILVKQMIHSFVIDKPVGIIDPVVRCLQMHKLLLHIISISFLLVLSGTGLGK